MMFCTQCGNKLNDTAKFCPRCGNRVNNPEVSGIPAVDSGAAVAVKEEAPAVAPAAPTEPQMNSFVPQENVAPAAPTEPQMNSFVPQENVAPAAPVEPQVNSFVPQENIAPAAPAEKSKNSSGKKRRILPWIIAGGATVLVGAGALTWIFAQSSVLHLFMGDGGYAASVLTGYTSEVLKQNSAAEMSKLISGVSEYMPEPGDYTANELAIEVANNVAKSLGTNDLGASVNVQIQSGSITDSMLSNSDSGKEVVEELNSITFKGDISVGESALKAGLSADYGTGSFDAAALIEQDKISAMLPGVNDTVLFTESTTNVTVPEAAEEIGDIQENISDLYETFMKYYTKADFQYENGSITIGDQDINCTHITGEIAEDDLNDLVSDISDILGELNSDIGRSLSGFDAEKNDMRLVIESYVTGSNKPLGVTFSLTGKDTSGQKTTVSFSSTRTDKASSTELKLQKKSIIKLQTENTSATEGTFRLDIATNTNSDEKFTVKGDFSEAGTAEVFGMKLPVGKLSFSVGGSATEKLTSSVEINGEYSTVGELLSKIKFNLEAQSAEGGYKSIIGLDGGKLGGASITFDLQPKLNVVIPDMTNPQKSISIGENQTANTADMMDYQIAVLEKLNEVFSDKSVDAIGKTLFNSDEISASVEQLKSNRDRIAVYSGFNEYTITEANNYASDIYYCTNISEFTGTDLEIIKLYYDSTGALTILDNCGERDEMLRSLYGSRGYIDAYAEVFVWKSRTMYSPIGVSVVRTSDPSKIPSARPDAYNLIDRLYEWETDNISENYAVGTYPEVMTLEEYKEYYGEEPKETSKQADERLAKTVEQYNEYAETIFTEFGNYMKQFNVSPDSNDMTGSITIDIKDGEWSCNSYYNYYFTKDIVNGEITDITEYLRSKVSAPDNGVIAVYFSKGQLCGALITDNSWESFSPLEFELSYTTSWGYIDGVRDIYSYGTYPVLKSVKSDDMADILKKLNGTWKNDDNTLRINDSSFDTDKITSFSIGLGALVICYCPSEDVTLYYSTDFNTYLSIDRYEDGSYKGYEIYYTPEEYIKRH